VAVHVDVVVEEAAGRGIAVVGLALAGREIGAVLPGQRRADAQRRVAGLDLAAGLRGREVGQHDDAVVDAVGLEHRGQVGVDVGLDRVGLLAHAARGVDDQDDVGRPLAPLGGLLLALGRGRPGAQRHLVAVAHAVAVGVGIEGIGAPELLVAVAQAVAVGVGVEGIGPVEQLLLVGHAVAVAVEAAGGVGPGVRAALGPVVAARGQQD